MSVTIEREVAEPPDDQPVVITEPPAPTVLRSRADVVRLIIALSFLAVGIFVARLVGRPAQNLERSILDLAAYLPDVIEETVVIVIQVTAIYLPLVFLLALLVRRQFRRAAVAVSAAIVAAGVMRLLYPVLETPLTRVAFEEIGREVVRSASGFPSPAYLAAATAVIVTETPWLSRRMRRITVLLLASMCFARMASGTTLPRDLIAALALGWAVGCAALLVFGTTNRRPTGRDLVDTLARDGVALASIEASDLSLYRAHAYLAVTRAGRPLVLKVRSFDDRAADVLIRLYRRFRLRDEADESASVSLHNLAEHEALVASRAHDRGVSTLPLVAVADVGSDSVVLAFEQVPARRLGAADGADAPTLDDATLHEVWQVTKQLREARIAHRRLSLSSFLVAPDGRVIVVDFMTGVLAAPDELLERDVAQLLVDTAIEVDVTHAVRAAVDVLGPDPIAAVLPHLQPLALARPTRRALRGRPQLLDDVRAAVRHATGAPDVPLADLERVKPRTVMLVAASAVAIYVLLPQLADIGSVWNEVQNASWPWVGAALLVASFTFLGATISLRGAVPNAPPFGLTWLAQYATSFANFATPAQVGGLALNLRFLQRQGRDPAVAGTAVGLNTAAGLFVHLTLMIGALFGVRDRAADIPIPWQTILIVIVVFLALAGASFTVPFTRHLLRDRVMPVLRRSVKGIVDVSRRPAKIVQLIGGSLLVTLAYIAALSCSVQSVGGEIPVIEIAVVYLIGAALATAAPTPGGLGAVEAALAAGLVSAGMSGSAAFSAVLVYRAVTFWLPLLPGWLAFTALQRRSAL